MSPVPVLDLRDADAPSRATGFARALCEGLSEYGFVAVRGHGVDAARIAATYRAFESFFALPEADKARCGGAAGGQRGFTPFAVEHARDCAEPDLKEFFHVGREGDEPANLWPAALPELRAHATALHRELEGCARRLLLAIETGLSLEPGALASLIDGGRSLLRALHYPPVAHGERPAALRAAPHEDINLITLLCEASGAGLEILRPDGAWLPVECPAGTIVVDSGDMLSRITGGVLPATTHRVVRPPDAPHAHRYSLPFFAHPRPECDLTVLQPLRTPERLAAHPPITAGAYLAERLREIGLQ